MTRSAIMDMLHPKATKEIKQKYIDWIITDTNERPFYLPHNWASRKLTKRARDIAVKELKKTYENGQMSESEYKERLARIFLKYQSVNDQSMEDVALWEALDKDVFEKLSKQKEEREETITLFSKADERFGNMEDRVVHTEGYLKDHVAIHKYIKDMTSTYYRQLAHIMNRVTINTMTNDMNKKWIISNPKTKKEQNQNIETSEHIYAWREFSRQYANQAMGAPVNIPKNIYNDPSMKIKGTPYGWWADNRFANRINKIKKKLGLSNKDIPDNLQGFTGRDVQYWSNLEGQYELMTLMTHPKTPINNVFGGTMHTISSTGLSPFIKVRDYRYLQTIDKRLVNREAVMNLVAEAGVTPEQVMYEMGFAGSEFRSKSNRGFLQELIEKATKKPDKEIPKTTILELAGKYGIGKTLVNKAAKFMTIPERHLRTDAYMAHLIKAYERFGGAIKNINHPVLMNIARKGVQATQFLYNAPNRPGFSRTGLGKIMTRFQLWSWNAVRFRNDVRRMAKIHGFSINSEAGQKFARTMQIDMVVLALANMFMYSLFEQTLPAPYSYFQDTAEWLFGDEKTRDRAFFGTYPSKLAPLQLITPPLARIPISFIREFAEDDYDKLANYYIWTMFPFGRMGRDLLHPEQSILKNPMRAPERLFGFPLTNLAKKASEDEPEYIPRKGIRLGVF